MPTYLPPLVDIAGAQIPVASMFLALVGLAMARGVSSAREGPRRDGRWVTGTLAMIVVAVVIHKQLPPGPAIVWGVGIGAGGIVTVDLLKDGVTNWLRRLVGLEPKDGGK